MSPSSGTYRGNVLEAVGTGDPYGLWRGYMIGYWGKYCSYCGIPMGTALQVEHRDPKSVSGNPYASTEWSNMLLSCASCNRTKSDHPNPGLGESVNDYLWPDRDIRFSPNPNASSLEYYRQENTPAQLHRYTNERKPVIEDLPQEAAVLVRPGHHEPDKARKTIKMLKLNGIYESGKLQYRTTATDRRVYFRTLAWDYALNATQRLETVYSEHNSNSALDQEVRAIMERQITSTAVSSGFWSVWMTVFYQEVNAGHLNLVAGDSIQKLLKRLFITGIPALDLRFKGTALSRVGAVHIGDMNNV